MMYGITLTAILNIGFPTQQLNSFSILERDSSQQEQLPLRGQEDPVPIANNIAVLPARLRIGETYFREEKQRENNPKYLPDLMIRKGFSYNHCYRRA